MTDTQTRRERVAERLHDFHRPFPAHPASGCWALVPCPMLADAVLAALADDPLPEEWPSGSTILTTFRDGYNDTATEFGVPTTDQHNQSTAMCCAAGAFAVAQLFNPAAIKAALEGN